MFLLPHQGAKAKLSGGNSAAITISEVEITTNPRVKECSDDLAQVIRGPDGEPPNSSFLARH